MSEEFENCETEFNKIINQIEKMLGNVQNLEQNKKDKTLIDIKYEFNEADQQIKQMEIETSSLPLQTKQQLQQKVKRYRNEWDNLRKRYIRIEEQITDEKRKDSLMDQKIELSDVESTGRERFIKTGAMLSDGKSKLKGALKELYQVEDTSNQISAAIVDQNRKLGKMIQDNNDISNNLGESNRLADRIKNNIRKNKIVLYVVSLIIIIAIGIIVWLKV